MIQKNLFIHDKRVYLKTDDYGTIDATTYVLSLVRNWFIVNDYHITKEINPENGVHALMYSNDEELVEHVENIYKIKEKDFTLTTQDEELKYIKDLRSKE